MGYDEGEIIGNWTSIGGCVSVYVSVFVGGFVIVVPNCLHWHTHDNGSIEKAQYFVIILIL